MIVYSTTRTTLKLSVYYMYIQAPTEVINSAVIIHIDKFPYLSYVKFKPVENLFFIIDNRLKLGSVITFCLILYWFKPKYDFWSLTIESILKTNTLIGHIRKNISYFGGNIHTFSIDFGTPIISCSLSLWINLILPFVLIIHIPEIDETYPSFSALVYCQRFRTLICLANGLSRKPSSFIFLKLLCFHAETNYYSTSQKSFVEMGI
jgi:hypothetical protein